MGDYFDYSVGCSSSDGGGRHGGRTNFPEGLFFVDERKQSRRFCTLHLGSEVFSVIDSAYPGRVTRCMRIIVMSIIFSPINHLPCRNKRRINWGVLFRYVQSRGGGGWMHRVNVGGLKAGLAHEFSSFPCGTVRP